MNTKRKVDNYGTNAFSNPQKGEAMKKYFEYIGPTERTKSGETAKFWEITVDRLTVSVRYGKLGASGQVSSKDFESAEEAEKYG